MTVSFGQNKDEFLTFPFVSLDFLTLESCFVLFFSPSTFGLNWFYLGMLFVWASLVAQMVKSPPAVQETWVGFLGWEDPLEKGTATHSYSCLENPMDRAAWWATKSMRSQRGGHDWETDFHFAACKGKITKLSQSSRLHVFTFFMIFIIFIILLILQTALLKTLSVWPCGILEAVHRTFTQNTQPQFPSGILVP